MATRVAAYRYRGPAPAPVRSIRPSRSSRVRPHRARESSAETAETAAPDAALASPSADALAPPRDDLEAGSAAAEEEETNESTLKLARWGEQLAALGRASAMRTTVGARRGTVAAHFAGGFLGANSDIASGELRRPALQTLSHLGEAGRYYIPPRFTDRVLRHVVKNYLAGSIDGPVPLILGIWGAKGSGKTLGVALACKALGLEPVFMSAGEMEDVSAGGPGRRLRGLYRTAVAAAAAGTPSALVISDLDAGAGRFKNSQMTVNTQNLSATLMALCDDPAEHGLRPKRGGGPGAGGNDPGRERGDHRAGRPQPRPARVPILVTANDLSVLYAPLLRDGRMDKFHWVPDAAETFAVLQCLFPHPPGAAASLLASFPDQSLDFFGAVASRCADGDVRDWVNSRGGPAGAGAAILAGLERGDARPVVDSAVPSLEALMAAGNDLAREQREVAGRKLAAEYFKPGVTPPPRRSAEPGTPESSPPPLSPAEAAAAAQAEAEATDARRAAVAVIMDSARARQAIEAAARAAEDAVAAAAEAAAKAAAPVVPWRMATVDAIHATLFPGPRTPESGIPESGIPESVILVDVRPPRDVARTGTVVHPAARSAPLVTLGGSLSARLETERPGFVDDVIAMCGRGGRVALLCGDGGKRSARAAGLLDAAGFEGLVIVEGGFEAWAKAYNQKGQRRAAAGAFRGGAAAWSDS